MSRILEHDTGYRRQHAVNFLAPFALAIVIFIVMPVDLFSTAMWYDRQGWNMVLSTQLDVASMRPLFFGFLTTGIVSVEGTFFSLMTMLMQLTATAIIIESGQWIKGQNLGLGPAIIYTLKGKAALNQINAGKVAALAGWLILVIFDGYTSVQFRTSSGVSNIVVLLVFAVGYENVMSEIAFGEFSKRTINLLPTLAELIPILLAYILSLPGRISRTYSEAKQAASGAGRGQRPQNNNQRPQRPDGNQRPQQRPDNNQRPQHASRPGPPVISPELLSAIDNMD